MLTFVLLFTTWVGVNCFNGCEAYLFGRWNSARTSTTDATSSNGNDVNDKDEYRMNNNYGWTLSGIPPQPPLSLYSSQSQSQSSYIPDDGGSAGHINSLLPIPLMFYHLLPQRFMIPAYHRSSSSDLLQGYRSLGSIDDQQQQQMTNAQLLEPSFHLQTQPSSPAATSSIVPSAYYHNQQQSSLNDHPHYHHHRGYQQPPIHIAVPCLCVRKTAEEQLPIRQPKYPNARPSLQFYHHHHHHVVPPPPPPPEVVRCYCSVPIVVDDVDYAPQNIPDVQQQTILEQTPSAKNDLLSTSGPPLTEN